MSNKPFGKILGVVVFWGFAVKCAVTALIGYHDPSHRGSLYVGGAGLVMWAIVGVRILYFGKSK